MYGFRQENSEGRGLTYFTRGHDEVGAAKSALRRDGEVGGDGELGEGLLCVVSVSVSDSGGERPDLFTLSKFLQKDSPKKCHLI